MPGRREYDRADRYSKSTMEHTNKSRVMFFDNRNRRFCSRPARNRGAPGRSYVNSNRTENKYFVDSRDRNPYSKNSGQSVLHSKDQIDCSKSDNVSVHDKETKDADCANQSLHANSEIKEIEVENESERDLEVGVSVNAERKPGMTDRPRLSVVQLLREFDETRQRTEFSRNFYTCKICFQVKYGCCRSLGKILYFIK